jgi:hypothetical protein
MRRVEFHRWIYTDEEGRLRSTSYRMTREAALSQWPDATLVPYSLEMRDVPESADEVPERRRPAAASRLAITGCSICRGAGWICADHQDRPWQHDACVGARMSCVCRHPAGAGAVAFERATPATKGRPGGG